ncbi:MAG: DUF2188 domain-containing protein [Acidimicrobiales bacterium]
MANPTQPPVREPGTGVLPNVVVTREGNRWAVRREDTDPVLSTHASREEALQVGRRVAFQGGVELIWEDEHGKVEGRTPVESPPDDQ